MAAFYGGSMGSSSLFHMAAVSLAAAGAIWGAKVIRDDRSLRFKRWKTFLWWLPILITAVVFGHHRASLESVSRPADTWAEGHLTVQAEGVVSQFRESSYAVQVDLREAILTLEDGSAQVCRSILVNLPEGVEVKLGNRISVSGVISAFSYPGNPGQFHTFHYYKALGFSYQLSGKSLKILDDDISQIQQWLYERKQWAKNRLRKITTTEDYGVYAAMLLGESSELGEETEELYKENGISHILVISGSHISLLGMALYGILRRRFRFWVSGVVSGTVMFGYVVMSGMGVSAIRAWVMFVVLLLSWCIGRCYDVLSAMSLSALLLLWEHPFLLFHAGCLLSFTAVFGIGVLASAFSKYTRYKGVVAKAFLSSLSVQLMTLPILAYFFFTFPPYSLILNLAIIPCATFVLLSGILGIAGSCLSALLGKLGIGLGHYILEFYLLLCRIGSSLPGHTILLGRPSSGRLLVYYGIVLAAIIGMLHWNKREEAVEQEDKQDTGGKSDQSDKGHKPNWVKGNAKKPRRMAGVLCLTLLLISILYYKQGESGLLEVTCLDVSQGDGISIHTPTGTNYFIDGGSSDVGKVGEYRIVPFLLSGQIHILDYCIVTHADQDHVSGLQELLASDQIMVKHLLLPEIPNPDEAYTALIALAEKADTKVVYLSEGSVIQDGEVSIRCLYPYRGLFCEDRNGYSTVLHMSYGEADFIFTGDIGEEGEAYLTQADVPECEVLKVAHHGSQTSSSEAFLAAVSPELALISCGKDNRYGHPHEETVERLNEVGALIYQTPVSGAITVKTDGNRIYVDEFAAPYGGEKGAARTRQ
jgi:competence protein ComEC